MHIHETYTEILPISISPTVWCSCDDSLQICFQFWGSNAHISNISVPKPYCVFSTSTFIRKAKRTIDLQHATDIAATPSKMSIFVQQKFILDFWETHKQIWLEVLYLLIISQQKNESLTVRFYGIFRYSLIILSNTSGPLFPSIPTDTSLKS